jgi:ferritin-like metal-binding protein YciE
LDYPGGPNGRFVHFFELLISSVQGAENMTAKILENLFHEILKDVFYGEKRLLRSLPKMAKGVSLQELAAAFERHGDEIQGQVERLEKVFETLGKPPEDRTWPVIGSMIDEALEFLQQYKASPALDAGLLAAAQAVGHYKIVRYGTLERWAGVLGMQKAAMLLSENLEKACLYNRRLTALTDYVVQAETLNFETAPSAVHLSEAA